MVHKEAKPNIHKLIMLSKLLRTKNNYKEREINLELKLLTQRKN